MIITRRGLLGMFAAGTAAAIVRPGLLMPVKPRLVASMTLPMQPRTVWATDGDFSFDVMKGRHTQYTQFPVLDGVKIWTGDMLVIDKTGYVRPMKDMSEYMIGVAVENVL